MKNSFAWRNVFHTRAFVVFVFGAAPTLNFMTQNALDPHFVPGRSLLYLVVILTFSFGLTLALDTVFKSKKSLFFAFFIGMSIFVTLNGYHISNLVFDGFFRNTVCNRECGM